MSEQVKPLTESELREAAMERLQAWAGCVQRLIAAAPIAAVAEETGVRGGHSTPPERQALREAARTVVDGRPARDLALLAHEPPA